MSDKDKVKVPQPKNIPKDGQVIMSIMKEMGIQEYEPKTIIQLTEFVYRYATSILEEARMYANNSKKKILDVEDVSLALQLTSESTFTTPPPREVILECANQKNYTPLPLVKPHVGLRLPPDRYCLSSCNYTLKSSQKKKTCYSWANSGNGIKITAKPNISYIKKTNSGTPNKQTITMAKSAPKTTIQQPTAVLKQKVQLPQMQMTSSNGINMMDFENGLKRKRDDEME